MVCCPVRGMAPRGGAVGVLPEGGYLVATLRFEVEPEPRLLGLLERYTQALRHAVRLLLEHRVTSLGGAHRLLYRLLRGRYGLPSRAAIDCYREALSIVKSWLRNRRRGRYPWVRSKRMWLGGGSYRLDLGRMEAVVHGVRVRLRGWPRNLWFYRGWELREARLVYRDGRLLLHVTVRRRWERPKPSPRALAVDVNERMVVAGDGSTTVRVPTRIEDAMRLVGHAERLQARYSGPRRRAWLRIRRVRERIRRLHRRARSILEDWARQTAAALVGYAQSRGLDTIVLEELRGLRDRLRELPRGHRRVLLLLGYRRLQYWIAWMAAKHGLAVVFLPPRGTSTTCPRCGARLHRQRGRLMKCPSCGLTIDRDEAAVMNLLRLHVSRMGAALTRPTAPAMTDENPSRAGEPSPPPRGGAQPRP